MLFLDNELAKLILFLNSLSLFPVNPYSILQCSHIFPFGSLMIFILNLSFLLPVNFLLHVGSVAAAIIGQQQTSITEPMDVHFS